MRQPAPEIKALAEEYSAKIQDLSDTQDRQRKALYEEYKTRHECLTKRIEGQGDAKNDYQTLLTSPGQTPEQGLDQSSHQSNER